MSRPGSFRWWWLNYSCAGHFFITFSVKNKVNVLSRVEPEGVTLLPAGEIVAEKWVNLHFVFPWVAPKDFVVMPDHFHGILWFDFPREPKRDPEEATNVKICFARLPRVVRHFKSSTTMAIRKKTGNPTFRWQEEREYFRIKGYIKENPERWLRKRERGNLDGV